jgi:hypothetical protein
MPTGGGGGGMHHQPTAERMHPCVRPGAPPGHDCTKKFLKVAWFGVFEPKCGKGELRGLSQLVQLYTGAQINYGDLTLYLTYVFQ